MKISNFKNLITAMPCDYQSFDIKSEIWKTENHEELMNSIFQSQSTVTINRFDLFSCRHNVPEFIMKTLMWGYPTKGRGKNIDNMLKTDSFNLLVKIVEAYNETDISINQITNDMKQIYGLGLSTISKFLHFQRATIEKHTALILDMQIIEVINLGRFEELKPLEGIRYENAINRYSEYLETISKIAEGMAVRSDQIEYFMFTFGKNLSEVMAEECDFDDADDALIDKIMANRKSENINQP